MRDRQRIVDARRAPAASAPRCRRAAASDAGGPSRPPDAYGSRSSSGAPGLRVASISATRAEERAEDRRHQRAEMLVVEVLVRRRERVLLEEEAAREDAEGLAGRAAAVPRDRPRLGDDPAPEDPLPPAEVHVLEVREVVVVEAARGEELLPAHGHQAAAGEEPLLARRAPAAARRAAARRRPGRRGRRRSGTRRRNRSSARAVRQAPADGDDVRRGGRRARPRAGRARPARRPRRR